MAHEHTWRDWRRGPKGTNYWRRNCKVLDCPDFEVHPGEEPPGGLDEWLLRQLTGKPVCPQDHALEWSPEGYVHVNPADDAGGHPRVFDLMLVEFTDA